jgi:hypothetical protein
MNKQGGRTVGLTEKLREARGHVAQGEVANPEFIALLAREKTGVGLEDPAATFKAAVEVFDDYVAQGEQYVAFSRDAVHDDYIPPPSEAGEIKRDWEAWGRLGMMMCEAAGVPIEKGLVAVARGRV